MISELAIWYLRKRKKSVMIGMLANGGNIQQNNRNGFLYDNHLCNVKYFTADGHRLDLPEGKFHYELEGK